MLASRLLEMDLADPVVIALPRGGVPVGFEVASALRAPLDIGLVRKLGHPNQPELGLGAIGEDGTVVVDERATEAFGITREQIELIAARESAELDRRRRLYRGDTPPAEIRGRTVIVVDDGIATGVTASAASHVLKAQGAARVILAVPVCPAGTADRIDGDVDEVVSLSAPQHFSSVGSWYDDFSQTSDEEVVDLLDAAREHVHGGETAADLAGEVDDPDRRRRRPRRHGRAAARAEPASSSSSTAVARAATARATTPSPATSRAAASRPCSSIS